MKDNLGDRLIALAALFLVIGSPVVGTLVFQKTNNFGEAIGLALVCLFAGLLTSFFTKVWEILNARWAVRCADWLEGLLSDIFSGYRKRYLKHLVYRFRDFDVKGLSTQGTYALELGTVFVELSVVPQSPQAVYLNPIQSNPASQPVWEYLRTSRKSQPSQRLAILGPPGSGKTTLLKHMALVMAGSRSQQLKSGISRKIPILLFLREHVQNIVAKPETRLADRMDAITAKWDLDAPADWFERELKKGNCLVLLDGLDEVGDALNRAKVVEWVENQMKIYPLNNFVITSRPYGFYAGQVSGADVLAVMPFNPEQIKRFIHNWYLANEIRSHRLEDEGVRLIAREGAIDLINRLNNDPVLIDLAINPLLLTMIATVHRYRSSLPGRRVELYKEICEVFLGKRQASKGLEDELTPIQKQTVLESLAYTLMVEKKRELSRDRVLAILGKELKSISPQCQAEAFLAMIENSSSLLVERENGEVGFSHLTFQEYLAAVYGIDHRLEDEWVEHIEDIWWHETIRLYAAQTDATAVVKACLKGVPLSLSALMLIIEVNNEARSMDPEIRAQIELVVSAALEEV